MSKYSEILNFDLESLTNLSDVHFGYAEALIKTQDRRYYPYIASSFTIAGICKSIIRPGSGRESFLKAADYYKREDNSYWVVCSICAYDIQAVYEFVDQSEGDKNLYHGIMENILASALVDRSINPESYTLNTLIPVGRLNIPIKAYIDALGDVSKIKGNIYNTPASYDNVISFLKRSSESIYLLREDAFHWHNLYGNFIPLEPEILGACIALCKQLNEVGIPVDQIFELIEISRIATRNPLNM